MSYLASTFRSLGHRAYRLYFTGQVVSTVGNWAQKVGLAWLVLELTGSGTMLGITAGLQQSPMLLLTPWAGLLADRVDRRTILLWTQVGGGLPATLLAVLAVTGRLTVPTILVLASVMGVAEAFDKPVRHTFAADIVPGPDVTNAVALNATMFNVGKVLGPAAAGLSIGTIGLGAPFAFNALSYAVMTVCLLRIRPAEIHARDLGRAGPGALRAGLRYARRTPVLAATLALMTATGLVAYEWTTAVPLLARAHSADPASIGYFFAAMGVGAIAGSLALAGVLSSTPRTLLIGGAAFSLSLAVVAATPGMALALAAMVVLGAAATTFRALATSLVQLEAEPAARGRMVSLLILALNGTSPVSGPLIGSMSELLGARVALAIGAGVSMLATAAAWRYLTAAAPDRLRPGDRMPVAS